MASQWLLPSSARAEGADYAAPGSFAVQTIDETWTDIANFHFTTASARKIINLSSLTPVTTQVTPTDGTMAANTAQDSLIGSQIRVKYGSSGTYAGGTTIEIDVISTRLQQP